MAGRTKAGHRTHGSVTSWERRVNALNLEFVRKRQAFRLYRFLTLGRGRPTKRQLALAVRSSNLWRREPQRNSPPPLEGLTAASSTEHRLAFAQSDRFGANCGRGYLPPLVKCTRANRNMRCTDLAHTRSCRRINP